MKYKLKDQLDPMIEAHNKKVNKENKWDIVFLCLTIATIFIVMLGFYLIPRFTILIILFIFLAVTALVVGTALVEDYKNGKK